MAIVAERLKASKKHAGGLTFPSAWCVNKGSNPFDCQELAHSQRGNIMENYTPLSAEQKNAIKTVKDKSQLLMDFLSNCDIKHNNFYMEFAIASLEESVMWALKSIKFYCQP